MFFVTFAYRIFFTLQIVTRIPKIKKKKNLYPLKLLMKTVFHHTLSNLFQLQTGHSARGEVFPQ